MNKTDRSTEPLELRRRPARDPLPFAMLSPASAIAVDDEPRIAPEIIVVSAPPPARVLP